MTEVPRFKNFEIDPTAMELRLEYLQLGLAGWHNGHFNENLYIQKARAHYYQSYRNELASLIAELKMSGTHVARLTTGSQPVQTLSFSKGAYDTYTASPRELDPGFTLDLKSTTKKHSDLSSEHGRVPKEFYSAIDLYAGDYRQYVCLSDLAKTLAEGGKLTLIENLAETEAE